MTQEPLVDSSTVNTVLLVLVLPAVAGLWRTLSAVNKTLSSLHAALVGVEGQGGALAEILGLRKRVHKLESLMSAVLIHTGIEPPPKRRMTDEDDEDDE